MSTFDPDAYFARKLENASATSDKLISLSNASRKKAAELEAYAPVAEARREQFKAQKAADDASWVGRAGLDPNGVLGEVVGKTADFLAGGSRQVVGTAAALPANLASKKINAEMSQEDITAYNNYVEGKATPAELERLNRVPGIAEQLTNAAITAGKGLSKGMIDPAGFSLDASTKLDKFKAAEQLNQQARKTTDLFDISSIQHTANKRGLDEALGKDFQANWDKVKGVFTDPANATYMANAPTTGLSERGNIPLEGMKYAPGAMETVDTIDGTFVVPAGKDAKAKFGESMQHFGKFKDQESAMNYIQQLNKQAVESKDQSVELGAKGNTKDAMARAGETVSGMAGLLSNAGRAAMENKSGVASYIAENLLPLAVGAFGPAGLTLMTASNVGYAADNYQKGLENYAKANNGKLPSRDEQDYMARMAATLAVAEQLGDSLSLGVGKVIGKAGKSRIVNAAKAAVAGGIGETATEGYQTFGEGEATGKPATAEDIYKGAVIGGLSGGALTGGMAFLHTPARVRDAQGENQSEAQLKEFASAAEKNDPTPFTDKTKATYDPAKGIGVLLQHALRPDATPEIKAKNLESATEIVSQMEDAVTKAQEVVDTHSPAEVARYEKLREDTTAELAATPETDVSKRAELTDTLAAVNEQLIDSNDKKQALRDNTKLSKLTRQLEDGRNRLQALSDIVATPTSTQEVTEIVDQIKAPAADVTPEAKAKAIDSVINLSMTHPDSLTSKQANDLANDTSNELSDVQRKHLREFSAARIAENQLNLTDDVTAKVFFGSPDSVGISQYRERIASALQAGNTKAATTQFNMLQKFADDHASKAAAARQAMRKGMGNQIVKLTDGSGWVVVPKGQKLDMATMDKNGGLTIKSARLVDNIAKESAALNATVSEMNSAMGMKFGVQSGSLQTAPEKNNTTKKMVEGEARPEVNSVPEESQTQKIPTPNSQPSSLLRDLEVAEKASDAVDAHVLIESKDPVKKAQGEKIVAVEKQAYDALRTETARIITRIQSLDSQYAKDLASKLEDIPDHITDISNSDLKELFQEVRDYSKEVNEKQGSLFSNFTKSETVSSPSALPASPAVAVAPAATASPLATETQTSPTAKPVAVQQPAVVSEASKAPVADTAKVEAVQENQPTAAPEQAVAAVHQKAKEGSTFQEKRLGDFFMQVGAGVNPLASVKDFLSTIKTMADLHEWIPSAQGKFTNAQIVALKSFKKIADRLTPRVTENLFERTNQNYAYDDMMNYFILPDGDIDANVKTAIVYAFTSYVVENAGGSRYNTNEQVAKLLGADKDHLPTKEERALLGSVIGHQSIVLNQLGQRVIAALGLKPKEGTPLNMPSQLAASIGAHVLRLLVDGKNPVITRKFITVNELKRVLHKNRNSLDDNVTEDTSGDVVPTPTAGAEVKEKYEIYLEFSRDDEGNISPSASYIIENNRDSQGVVNKLFSVEEPSKPPTFKPVTKLAALIKRSKQVVPGFLLGVMEGLNKQENFLRQDKLNLRTAIGTQAYLEMMGWVAADPVFVHAANLEGQEASNAALERELANMDEFIYSYLEPQEKGFEQPFFFSHYATRQQRVMIDNKLVNPQLSKLQRFMIYRQSWKTTVTRNDADSMNNFWLRTAEGFGFKTERMSTEEAVAEVQKRVADPVMQAAIAVAAKAVVKGATLTQEEKDALVAGVALGKEKAHSLDALVGLAEESKGADVFTVNMLAEVDGVTNGPMLSHLALGAAETVADLFKVLNRGGFFAKGSGITEFNQWRSAARARDLYESISANMQTNMAKLINDDKVDSTKAAHIEFFLGSLQDENGAVTSAGRNLLKTPVTAVGYSSSLKTAINEGMVGDFVAGIYKRIEKLARDTDNDNARVEVIKAMQGLGLNIRSDATVEELMATEFNKKEIDILTKVFAATFGKAVTLTLRADFKSLMERRRLFTKVADITYGIYDATYKGVREAYIAELVASGAISAQEVSPKDKKGKAILNAPKLKEPIHDLNAAQEKELDTRMAKITPVLQTAMSNYSGVPERNTGIMVAKTERKVDSSLPYKNQVKFGTKFADNGTQSTMTYGSRVVNARPGVSMDATSTQSIDSAIMHTAIDDEVGNSREVLGLHDAQGTGIHQVQESGKALNEATWLTNLHYSPAQEMYNSYARVIKGLSVLLNSSEVPSTVVQNIAKELVHQSNMSPEYDATTFKKGPPIPATSILLKRAAQMKVMAYQADQIRLGLMAEMETIAQYAVEGGAYHVSDKERAVAEHLLKQLDASMTDKDLAAFKNVEEKLKRHIKAAEAEQDSAELVKTGTSFPDSTFGTLGTSKITADPALVNWFTARPERTAGEVIAFMKKHEGLTSFQRLLVSAIGKSLAGRSAMPVRMVTATTQAAAVKEMPARPSMGWFVSKDGKSEVNLLSPEFTDSGLTVELVLHELLHASVAEVINNPSTEAKPLVTELYALMTAAKTHAEATKVTGFDVALNDIQEFVTYGMTNVEFQDKVLKTLQYATKSKTNVLLTGFAEFINKMVGLVFGRENATMATGMEALITNVAGLMKESSAQVLKDRSAINLSMAQPVPNLRDLSTLEIHEALNSINNNGVQVSAAHDARLRDMLTNMVSKLYGPFGSFKADLMEQTAQTPDQVYQEALITGKAPYAQEASLAGFALTEQEEFAMEQVQSVVAEAISGKDGTTAQAYRELAKLYDDVRSKVTAQSFLTTTNPTTVETKQAQALYDFMFATPTLVNGKSEYLSRFAGLAMAHEATHNMLAALNTKSAPSTGKQSFNDRLSKIINNILNWFGGKFTNTYSGQPNDAKLASLVQQMIKIEAKKRNKLEAQALKNMQPENFVDKLSGKASAKLAEFAALPFFKTNANPFIKAIGSIATVVAKDQSDAVMEALQKIRDQNSSGQQGLLAATVAEVRGSHAGNLAYLFLGRAAKHLEGIRKTITDGTGRVVMKSFVEGGKNLTDDMKKAISAVFLRTDMQSLLGNGYTLDDLTALLGSKTKVQAEIYAVEAKLAALQKTAAFRHYYSESAKALGFRLVTGKITNDNTMMNAHNIANLYLTPYQNRVSQADALIVTPLIDSLVSLYAIKYTREDYRTDALAIMQAEKARTDGGGNGVEMLLRMHAHLAEDSRKQLFEGSEALYMKGHTPEIYDPYMSVEIANEEDGKELILKGYKKSERPVGQDKANPTEAFHIYSLRDGGLIRRVTGTISFTGTAAMGTRVHNGNLSRNSYSGQYNASTMASIASKKRSNIAAMFRARNFDPTTVEENFMAPVVNANGDAVNYRYMMEENTKDVLLNRNNRPEKLLGTMAGTTFDKVESPKQNREVIKAMHEQFVADFAVSPAGFLNVGPKSTDPELREIWRRLPEKTKQDVRSIWGTEGMRVKAEVLDMNFGYKKLSVSDAFDTEATQRSLLSKMFVLAMSYAFDEKARLRSRQIEEVWQEVVKATKGNLVVRSFSTLSGNFRSNTSQLLLSGVNPAAIIKGHVTAFKGAWSYKQDSRKLAELVMHKQTGYTGHGISIADMDYQIAKLQDNINRNPIKPLLDAGLMPTIVEDIEEDDDQYSYKSRGVKYVKEKTDALNPNISKLGGFLLMAEGTKPYQIMSYATQISDFLARFVLYEHLTTKRDPMTHEEAVQRVSDAFINYDVPTHRKLQYANDSGLVMFTKYYLRIQKMLVRIYREHPGRVLAMIAAEKFLIGAQPTVLDSSMMNRLGNPINLGALDYPGSLDSLATVRILTSPFSGGGNPTE